MKTLLPNLFGNDESKTVLCNSIKNQRMPQTLILEGDDGSGKKIFARELAKAIFCNGNENASSLPCDSCRRCERVKKSLTPDLVFVKAEDGKVSLSVYKVREITAQALVGPCEMPALVFIIEGADDMNDQSQNAFLLALENPPEDVVYILLCKNSSKLLETIRSRAFTFRMELFSAQTIESWILNNTDIAGRRSREDIYEASNAANGRIGRALLLLSDESMSAFHTTRQNVLGFACALVEKSMPKSEKLKKIYSLPMKREVLAEYFYLLSDILHDLILLKLDESAVLSFFTEKAREEALTLSDNCRLRALYDYRDAVGEAISSLLMNASVNGVRTSFAMKTGIL